MSQVFDLYTVSRAIRLPARRRDDFWVDAQYVPIPEDTAAVANNSPGRVLSEAACVLGTIAVLILVIGALVPG